MLFCKGKGMYFKKLKKFFNQEGPMRNFCSGKKRKGMNIIQINTLNLSLFLFRMHLLNIDKDSLRKCQINKDYLLKSILFARKWFLKVI
jgi:hypothetical protein